MLRTLHAAARIEAPDELAHERYGALVRAVPTVG